MPPKAKAPAKPVAKKAAAPKPDAGPSKPAAKPEPKKVEKMGVEIPLKRLATVVLDGADGTIKASGRWPFIIDTSESQAAVTFLKYRDTNVIDATNVVDMVPEKIRLALLGSLRYGKNLLLALQGEDLYGHCVPKFDEVLPGLMDLILSKEIMKEEHFSKLIKPQDDEEYQLRKMTSYESKIEHFQMIFATAVDQIPDKLAGQVYTVTIEQN